MSSALVFPAAPDSDVDHWRYDHLRELGLSVEDSLRVVAENVSWHDVERLTRRGCSAALAVEILL